MAKEKIISFRTDLETEHKLNWLIATSDGQTISEILELAIHNEWASQNYSNLCLMEELQVDPEYKKMISERVL